MQAVYSFWSAPALARGSSRAFEWPSKEHHALAWALSVELARRHFGDVLLVTDSWGARYLVDRLRLPFTRVSRALDSLSGKSPALWNRGKFVAYRVAADEGRPFVHLDSDVFLTRPLPQALTSSGLFAQSIEPLGVPQHDFYPDTLERMNAARTPVPASWLREWSQPYAARPAYNMGIVGGSRVDVLGRYAREAEALASVLDSRPLEGAHPQNVCVTVEQYGFGASARAAGLPVRTLLGGHMAGTPGAEHLAEKAGYAHLYGDAKQDPDALNRMAARARREVAAFDHILKYA